MSAAINYEILKFYKIPVQIISKDSKFFLNLMDVSILSSF